ncbi:MAG: hypothetical protein IKT56_02750 [Clostridia bacterium]|nr:hypothetical protein [Clostridia bacterium]
MKNDTTKEPIKPPQTPPDINDTAEENEYLKDIFELFLTYYNKFTKYDVIKNSSFYKQIICAYLYSHIASFLIVVYHEQSTITENISSRLTSTINHIFLNGEGIPILIECVSLNMSILNRTMRPRAVWDVTDIKGHKLNDHIETLDSFLLLGDLIYSPDLIYDYENSNSYSADFNEKLTFSEKMFEILDLHHEFLEKLVEIFDLSENLKE